MAYRLRKSETVNAGVKRIAREQILYVLKEADSGKLSNAKKVHQLRKRCKKLRGLIRSVRGSFDNPQTYSFENQFVRNAAHMLSSTRDADVMIETHDKLGHRFRDSIDFARFASIREQLVAHRDRIARSQGGEELSGENNETPLESFAEKMRQMLRRVDIWSVKYRGFRALQQGIERTYRRGRRMLYQAYATQSPDAFHEWRKRVKYHRYHCRMLTGVWPVLLSARWREVVRLSDFLGDEHDCTVLYEHLQHDNDTDSNVMDSYFELLQKRRHELREAAKWLGKRVYMESAGDFISRMETYWDAWQCERRIP